MCGILGCKGKDRSFEGTEDKLNLLKHRGPDDSGIFVSGDTLLAHTRLSILDTSSYAHQPMTSEDGRYTLIYNGEIYNFYEIKQLLLDRAYSFKSHSDSEVLLKGYIEFKESIVSMLNGMFAFAIYDKQEDLLFLGRDRSGIKPLYYIHQDNSFCFASELKALIDAKSKHSLEAKVLFLLLGYIPEPYTLYEDIKMFPAGFIGIYKNNNLNLKRFNKYKFEDKIEKPYSKIVTDIRDILEQSVKRHLVSDVAIGSFLSGGIDSSIITALASKTHKHIKTLSLVFEERSLNEESFQDLIASRFDTNHHKFVVNETIFLDYIDDFLKSMEQPTIDGFNTFLISRGAIENGLKVSLSGVGADELFFGYPSFKNAKFLNFMRFLPATFYKNFKSSKYKKLELLHSNNNLYVYLPQRALFSPDEIGDILKIDKKCVYDLIDRLSSFYCTKDITRLEDRISYLELDMYMKNQLLRDTDLFSMHHSLEIRVPFLDNELVDYVTSIKPSDKVGKYNKNLLVSAFKDILPKEIYDRKKMGFVLPFERWFKKNIDRYNVDENLKRRFLKNELNWSRFWAIYILSRFEI